MEPRRAALEGFAPSARRAHAPCAEAAPPLRSRTDAEVTLIAALITLTPGTLTLGTVPRQDGGRCLLVHSMYHRDHASALADLSHMEDRMLHALAVEDDR